jgi:hypothetical protein
VHLYQGIGRRRRRRRRRRKMDEEKERDRGKSYNLHIDGGKIRKASKAQQIRRMNGQPRSTATIIRNTTESARQCK